MASILHLIILLYIGIEASSSTAAAAVGGSRSILRDLSEPLDLPDAAIDLNITNFESILRLSPASYAIVEFFAHWCPACRNYKPQYEKVARLFNGPDAVHPGIVVMARVDCADKANIKLCDNFSIQHYPTLFWGRPSKFSSSGLKPKEGKSEIQEIVEFRKADLLLNFINKQIGSSYGLDDEKFENEHPAVNASDPGQIVRAVYDVEEATATAFDIILSHKMIASKTRAPLISFLQLLVAHHPSKRCRKGTAEFLVNFDDLWPSDRFSTSSKEAAVYQGNALSGFQICGKDVPRGYWIFCRGSKNETRGFSCGLWVLLHSLSVRIEDGESQMVFTTLCEFINNFFICEECRQHFYQMCSSVSAPFKKTQDLVLWLWTAHNEVNQRLMKEEASYKTGDPMYPKMIWPPHQLCPSCYFHTPKKGESARIDWNKDEVFKFLVNYYGTTLVSSYKDKHLLEDEVSVPSDEMVTSASVVAVPLGAALGIALASCAFGALACYWRSRQKNRKTRRIWS
ncbi:thiol oxidase [Ranunculus cassubicifolius]